MDTLDAETLMMETMREYGLLAEGWTFKWGHGKNQFGCCWPTRKLITLSRPLVALNSVVEVRDTILHEVAHALVGPGEGHGKVWQRKARELGARPERTSAEDAVYPDALYTLICPSCGRKTVRNRKTKTNVKMACGRCCNLLNGGKYSAEFKFKWYKTEGMIRMFV